MYERTEPDDRLCFIEAYDVFAGARENLEQGGILVLSNRQYIGVVALVSDDWDLSKFPDVMNTQLG